VFWGINANHGGGYNFRLCPYSGDRNTLTEECFQTLPLKFAGDIQWVQYQNGTRVEFKAKRVSVGTTPKGSQWTRNPIPACSDLHGGSDNVTICPRGTQFQPPGPGLYGFGLHDGLHYNLGIKFDFHWSIVDRLEVPVDLKPGRYAFSWRWDCEQSAQVWSSCADVTIVVASE